MAHLITLLISLLGYGSPADFSDYSEAQLQNEISIQQTQQSNEYASEDDNGGDWDISH